MTDAVQLDPRVKKAQKLAGKLRAQADGLDELAAAFELRAEKTAKNTPLLRSRLAKLRGHARELRALAEELERGVEEAAGAS